MKIQNFIKNEYMKAQLNVFAVCHNTCFRQTRQVINLLKLATSNKNNEMNNNNYYYNSNKILRRRTEVFSLDFVSFWRISVIGCISVFLVTGEHVCKKLQVAPQNDFFIFYL